MIQDGQLVKFVNGGDAARIQKVQIAVGRDATRAPRVQHSERGMPVQVVTGEDPTRAPFIHPFEGLAPAAWFRKGNATTASWPDLSGNARTMTFFNTPTIEADGAVTMNGTNQYGKTAAFTLNQPTWVLWVGKQVSWTSGDVILDGAGVAGGAMQQTTSTPRISISAGSSACEIATVTIGTTAVLSAVFNGASSSLSRNRDVAATGNAGTNTMGGLTLGAIGGGAAAWANITTSELILFATNPSATIKDRIIAGVMARHGVA